MTVRRIIKGVRRRVRLAFMNHVSANQQYKPIGIKKLEEIRATGDCEVLEISPPYTSTLDLAPKFIEDCSPFIKPVLTVQYPADYIATIRNGRVFSYDSCNRAVISSDNYLIEEASFQWTDALLEPEFNRVFRVKGFSRPTKYTGRVFSMLSIGSAKYYYYHWVFSAIAKLDMLKKSGLFDRIDYFLVPTYGFPYKYTKEYLDHFGIHEDRIINEDVEHHIQADLLLVCSEVMLNYHLPKWACNFLWDSFKKTLAGKSGEKLIYIARGDAPRNRKVINESALIELLKNFGFEVHLLSKLSVAEQAKLFNSARIIVAVHGGGLTNLVYCEPGTKVLEIFPDQYVRHTYYDLCQKKGLLYDYLLCESEGSATRLTEAELLSLTADLDAIRNKIEELVGVAVFTPTPSDSSRSELPESLE